MCRPASYTVVEDVEAGMAAIGGRYPTVIKADGLAAGKGVIIAASESEALDALHALLVERRFATEKVVVEEFLDGEELSLLALCDGETALPLASAQDYKRIFDGDLGPNTGGMGSYSPVPAVDAARAAEICASVHQPVLDELRRRGIPFHGVLYAGLMMTADGPRRCSSSTSASAIRRRRRSCLGYRPICWRCSTRRWCVVVWPACRWSGRRPPRSPSFWRAGGTRRRSSSGDVISGLQAVPPDVSVTHAGTAFGADGAIVTAGGRVLSVTALGSDAASARAGAYAAADVIEFDGKQLRRDIALRAVRQGDVQQ